MSRLIYGRKIVAEHVKAGNAISTVFILKTLKSRLAKFEIPILQKNIKIRYVDYDKLKEMCGTEKNEGVAAEVFDIVLYGLKDVLKMAKSQSEKPLIVMFDHIQDPHNFGAAIRSIVAFGAHGVVIPKNRSVKITPVVERASAGTLSKIPIAMVTNLNNCIEALKEAGYFICGADMEGDISSEQIPSDAPLCLIMGNEDKGLSALVKKNCDQIVSIPMSENTESLNVSVSTALLVYEWMKNQKKNG